MSTITASSTAPMPTPHPARVRRLLVGILLALIVAGTAFAAHLGCERMREVAPVGSVDSSGRTVTGHSWSISPIGFSVRYDDGTSATHLWW
jgi:hypothetical protein